MAITSIPSAIGAQVPGQLAYRDDDFLRTYSGILADANAVTPGYGLIPDTTNNSVKLPTAGAGALFCGVAIDDGTLPIDVATYAQGKVVPYVDGTRGVMVKTSQAVTLGDPVYLCDTAGGTGAIGTFRMDADGGKATLVPGTGVKWQGTFASGQAILTINLP